jgi:two-component system nitrate/nitrite response regulator NarL
MTNPSSPPGRAAVWLVDDQPLRRAGLKAHIAAAGFDIVAEGQSLEDLLQAGDRSGTPRLLVMDGSQGTASISIARAHHPDLRVMVLGNAAEPATMAEAFAAGAHGYVLKRISADALVESLRLLLTGEKVFPSEVSDLLIRLPAARTQSVQRTQDRETMLSPQEMEITRHLADGTPNKIIAQALDITEATVKAHVKTLMRKIGVSNRTQAAIWAHTNGVASAAANRSLGLGGKQAMGQG